ncbi:MAG TPA: acyltransferase [Acetobacteraceae bacterium]|nr:acyltransferase [Acetobacteraceae bacterium]
MSGARPAFHNPTIHGARGLFALAVLIFHVANYELPNFAWAEAAIGRFVLVSLQHGVDLFFAISGFVILGALRRAPSVPRFLLDRAIRIYPVLWASILAVIAFGVLARRREFAALAPGDILAQLPLDLLPISGVWPVVPFHRPAWSLAYEAVFYALLAAVWAARPVLGARAATAGGVALAVLLVLIFPRAAFFLVGLAVAEGLVARRPPALGLARWPTPWLLLCFALLGAMDPAAMNRGLSAPFAWLADPSQPLLLAGALLAGTIAFRGLIEGQGGLGHLLRTTPLQWCGTVSYSLYLWHLPVLGVVRMALVASGLAAAAGPWATLLLLLIGLPLSLLVSAVSHRVLEDGAGRRLRARLGAARPAPA